MSEQIPIPTRISTDGHAAPSHPARSGSGPATAPATDCTDWGDDGLRLAPCEPAAVLSDFSRAKRDALMECLLGRRLTRQRGRWRPDPDLRAGATPIAGVTVANLARDGLLRISAGNRRLAEAYLTPRGSWYARTLLDKLRHPAGDACIEHHP